MSLNAKLDLINHRYDVFKAHIQPLLPLFYTCISSNVPSLFLSLSQGKVLLIQSRSCKQMNPKEVVNQDLTPPPPSPIPKTSV